jgi:septum formation protein
VGTLVLASTSEWRRHLLREAGIEVDCVPPEVDEAQIRGTDPVQTALMRAEAKAAAVAKCRPGVFVLGADQVIHLDGETIGKPPSVAVWRERLMAMRGREHALTTGVALWDGVEMSLEAVTTMVRFRSDITDEEIDTYIAGGEARGCAGGYMVERKGAWLVESIDGDWLNVVGLPVLKVVSMLRERGWRMPE